MRPTIASVNASIYDVQETALAPVEDLALSFEDFESLCADGLLKPHSRHLIVKPHVRLWSALTSSGRSRASGHVQIEGFLPNGVLRLAGYKISSEEQLSEQEEKKRVLDLLELSFISFLRKTFPDCRVTVSPPTSLHNA